MNISKFPFAIHFFSFMSKRINWDIIEILSIFILFYEKFTQFLKSSLCQSFYLDTTVEIISQIELTMSNFVCKTLDKQL